MLIVTKYNTICDYTQDKVNPYLCAACSWLCHQNKLFCALSQEIKCKISIFVTLLKWKVHMDSSSYMLVPLNACLVQSVKVERKRITFWWSSNSSDETEWDTLLITCSQCVTGTGNEKEAKEEDIKNTNTKTTHMCKAFTLLKIHTRSYTNSIWI